MPDDGFRFFRLAPPGVAQIDLVTVNNIVSDRKHSVTISTIKKLCDGIGITIEEFFNSELFRGLEPEIK